MCVVFVRTRVHRLGSLYKVNFHPECLLFPVLTFNDHDSIEDFELHIAFKFDVGSVMLDQCITWHAS